MAAEIETHGRRAGKGAGGRWRNAFKLVVLSGVVFSVSDPGIADSNLPAGTNFETVLAKSGATPGTYKIDYQMLPMRDGTRLATIIVRPRDAERHPVVLFRSPYSFAQLKLSPLYDELFASGYTVVFQNERGAQLSEGDFHFMGKVAQDGHDTIDWIARQPWSNGKVGTEGCSSPGNNQLVIGAQGNSALKAQSAMSAAGGVGDIPGVETKGAFFRGGVPRISTWALWYSSWGAMHPPKMPSGRSSNDESAILRYIALTGPNPLEPPYNGMLDAAMSVAPSAKILRTLGSPLSDYDHLIHYLPTDRRWSAMDHITSATPGTTPTLNINGWMDFAVYETVKLFEFQQHAPEQYMIVSPSGHCAMIRTAGPDSKVGERPMGDTSLPYVKIQKAWFDRFLKGDDKAWAAMPRVQVFLMGANTWLTGDRWPLPETKFSRLYLGSSGRANTRGGDGILSLRPGRANEDNFESNPLNPIPTNFNSLTVPSADQGEIEDRRDVLVYSTPPLTKGIAIAGDITFNLHVSVDTKDTDIAVKLVDVYPDGKAFNVQDSILRLRYRNGVGAPRLLEAGKVYPVKIGEMTTANYFAPGHRLRIEISGSAFPRYDRNWNTGGRNEDETSGKVARVRVLHGGADVSFVEFREYIGKLPNLMR